MSRGHRVWISYSYLIHKDRNVLQKEKNSRYQFFKWAYTVWISYSYLRNMYDYTQR